MCWLLIRPQPILSLCNVEQRSSESEVCHFTRMWTSACLRRDTHMYEKTGEGESSSQKVLRPVTLRSGPVSEVPQGIHNCHRGRPTCSCTALWQWYLIAATFIIWNDLRKSPADGKTDSHLLTFLVVQVVFLSLLWLKQQHTQATSNYSWTLTRMSSSSSTWGGAESFPHTIWFKCRILQLNQKKVSLFNSWSWM